MTFNRLQFVTVFVLEKDTQSKRVVRASSYFAFGKPYCNFLTILLYHSLYLLICITNYTYPTFNLCAYFYFTLCFNFHLLPTFVLLLLILLTCPLFTPPTNLWVTPSTFILHVLSILTALFEPITTPLAFKLNSTAANSFLLPTVL